MRAKRYIGLLLAAAMVIMLPVWSIPAEAASAGKMAAMSAEYTLSVDGKEMSLWVYEIGDGAYFKLRDLAMALNGTNKQFGVSWDGTAKRVSLNSGAAYTPVGGELSEPADSAGAAANLPGTDFYMDNGRIPVRTYLVNGSHYIRLSDLAANLMFALACDEEKRFAKIATQACDTGLYSLFFLPDGWSARGEPYDLRFTCSDDPVGELIIYNYEPDRPISQFQGNHAETLSSEELSGLAYPAEKAVIRRTQPAAVQDDSYMDELHIYILLADCRCAFDFSFDSAKVDERTALEIAENFRPDGPAIRLSAVAAEWAKAIQDRDGKAQYELLSAELQLKFKDYYESNHWTTGVSSPWVNSWTVEVSGNQAVVFYENRTSDGFAGYTVDTLSISGEDGQLKISGIDGYNNFAAHGESLQSSVQLPEAGVLLASLPGDNIAVYGDKDDYDANGTYEGLYLSINGVIRYSVDNAKLTATVPAQVSNALFIGDVNITYTFDGTEYVMDSIAFVPIQQ